VRAVLVAQGERVGAVHSGPAMEAVILGHFGQ
jgi:hypothetical protein